MAQGYYTLQEAAEFLGMSTDELKDMAKKNKLRSFQDRGTVRFREQDIEELARQRGASSDPELVLEEALPPRSSASPKTPAKTPKPKNSPKEMDVFEFELEGDDSIDIGREVLLEIPGTAKKSAVQPKSSGSQPKSGVNRKTKNVPPPGSDSEVRLVTEGSESFTLALDSEPLALADSNVKIGQESDAKSGSGRRRTKASKLGKSKLGSGAQPVDSGVRLVPIDNERDLKIIGDSADDEVPLGASPPPSAADSDVRLEGVKPARGNDPTPLTEEINLDEEIRKQEALLNQTQPKVKLKSELRFPTSSPFELSENDLGTPPQVKPDSSIDFEVSTKGADSSSDFELTPQKPDSSSDFDLIPSGAGQEQTSDFELSVDPGMTLAEDDFSLELPDDLDADPNSTQAGSMANPLDSGLALDDESATNMDFDLSLELEATPKPTPQEEVSSDSSEFELRLDDSDPSSTADTVAPGSDSEFELSLDDSPLESAPATGDSDSEFELTLDDSGEASASEEEPQVKADGDEEKDIFDTDFEVPELDESGSEVAALDTDLESSDFDLALDESDVASEDESGSQVVALDEEEISEIDDEEGEVDEDEVEEDDGSPASNFGDLDDPGEVVEEDAEATTTAKPEKVTVREKLVQPAPWGVLPVVVMTPCLVITLLVGMICFEMFNSFNGNYKPTGVITKQLAELLGMKMK